MRITRVEKFKKYRKKKLQKFIILGIFLPSSSIFVGYLITLLFILPAMAK